MLMKFIAIFIGGGLGALLRYAIAISMRSMPLSPLIGTLSANIIGCFLIGFVFALSINKVDMLPTALKLFIIVGFLGGLTTFSTFNIEIFELIKAGKIFTGLSYMVISCAIGLIATYLGYLLYSKIA